VRHGLNGTPKVPPEALGPEMLEAVDAILARHRSRPGALIPVLEEIQETLGYLPRTILERVARDLNLALSEVHGVATFYTFFSLVPRGRHTTRCCLGTACYVRGGRENMEKLIRLLKVPPGQTTPDRRFSLETVRCLGACGLAPVVMVDDDTYRQVKPAKIREILDAYA
jgi:NADH:ubiquinone oxidoreductase subunit E